MASPTDSAPLLPQAPVDRWLAPVARFLHVQAASGIVLLACTALALALANSPAAAWFAAIWKTPVSVSLAGFTLAGDVGHLIVNDGLMTIFFFVVGLEVKREIVFGELREPRKALLPVLAALGGVMVPAAIYLALQWGEPGQDGWAIPMATDIAFVVGLMALFGSRVPLGLKVMILSLAIVDDIVAVLIIALVFTETIAWGWLGVAGAAFALVYGFNLAGVRSIAVYAFIGVFIWLAFLQSGVHPTVAGVLLGLLTPARAWIGRETLADVLEKAWERISGDDDEPDRARVDVGATRYVAREAVSPLQRLEDGLHPWVAFVIMPLFALANAGVAVSLPSLGEPIAVSVAAGLVVGKPVGIMLMCTIAMRLGVTSLPAGVTWGMLTGGACLAGIGFTMALFLNGLAFPAAEFPAAEAAGKIGTLAGSLVSALIGASVLALALRRAPDPGVP